MSSGRYWAVQRSEVDVHLPPAVPPADQDIVFIAGVWFRFEARHVWAFTIRNCEVGPFVLDTSTTPLPKTADLPCLVLVLDCCLRPSRKLQEFHEFGAGKACYRKQEFRSATDLLLSEATTVPRCPCPLCR